MKRKRREKQPPAPRTVDQGPVPNHSEMVMYGTGGEFRPPAVRLYARRALVGEERAEEIIRTEMKTLGMNPDPEGRAVPAYQKLVN
jgi:hypothetical protein